MKKGNLEKEQKELVLARFRTLNPNSKIILGGMGEITVGEMIENIEEGYELGKKIVAVQIRMLQVLAT